MLEALVITLAIFSGITLYAFVSKKDFSFMGGALFAGLVALIGCSFINLLLGVTGNKSPALAFLISWGGSVLFSLYILYDSRLALSTFFFLFCYFVSEIGIQQCLVLTNFCCLFACDSERTYQSFGSG